MSVEFTSELEKLVNSIMSNGHYADEQEVLAEALRLLKNRDELRSEIKLGLAELDNGERIDGETLFEELRARATRSDQ